MLHNHIAFCVSRFPDKAEGSALSFDANSADRCQFIKVSRPNATGTQGYHCRACRDGTAALPPLAGAAYSSDILGANRPVRTPAIARLTVICDCQLLIYGGSVSWADALDAGKRHGDLNIRGAYL